MVKFIYSEKATKFCEISIVALTVYYIRQIYVETLQNFVIFADYMNFKRRVIS